jgi:uncharacterized protein
LGSRIWRVTTENPVMKTRNIVIVIILAVVIAIIFYSTGGTDDSGYIATIEKQRADRDRFMRASAESPIANKNDFKGLTYFPPDPAYRVVADLTAIEGGKAVPLATSDGKQETYREYAYADFTLKGIDCKLLILELAEGENAGKLFLAFADATSADETYGAGRYLDVEKKPGASTITLDFNLAYNPYCAYNDSFVCPLPPRENLLNVAVRAGEKSYH